MHSMRTIPGALPAEGHPTPFDLDALERLANAAIKDAIRWPIDWSTEMEDVDGFGEEFHFRCWAATSRKDGSTDEVTLGSEDYDQELAEYIARMNRREPQLADAIPALIAELRVTREIAEEGLDSWEERTSSSSQRERIIALRSRVRGSTPL